MLVEPVPLRKDPPGLCARARPVHAQAGPHDLRSEERARALLAAQVMRARLRMHRARPRTQAGRIFPQGDRLNQHGAAACLPYHHILMHTPA